MTGLGLLLGWGFCRASRGAEPGVGEVGGPGGSTVPDSAPERGLGSYQ